MPKTTTATTAADAACPSRRSSSTARASPPSTPTSEVSISSSDDDDESGDNTSTIHSTSSSEGEDVSDDVSLSLIDTGTKDVKEGNTQGPHTCAASPVAAAAKAAPAATAAAAASGVRAARRCVSQRVGPAEPDWGTRAAARTSARAKTTATASGERGAAKHGEGEGDGEELSVIVISGSSSDNEEEALVKIQRPSVHGMATRRTNGRGSAVAAGGPSLVKSAARTVAGAAATRGALGGCGDVGNKGGGSGGTAAAGISRGKAVGRDAATAAAATTADGRSGCRNIVMAPPAAVKAAPVPIGSALPYSPLRNTDGGVLYADARACLPLPEQHVRAWFPTFYTDKDMAATDTDSDVNLVDDSESSPDSDGDVNMTRERRTRQQRHQQHQKRRGVGLGSPKKLRLTIELVGHVGRDPRHNWLRGPHDATVKSSRGLEPYSLMLNHRVREALEGCHLLGYRGHSRSRGAGHSSRGKQCNAAAAKLYVRLGEADNEASAEDGPGGHQGAQPCVRKRTREEEEEEEASSKGRPRDDRQAAVKPKRPPGRPRKHPRIEPAVDTATVTATASAAAATGTTAAPEPMATVIRPVVEEMEEPLQQHLGSPPAAVAAVLLPDVTGTASGAAVQAPKVAAAGAPVPAAMTSKPPSHSPATAATARTAAKAATTAPLDVGTARARGRQLPKAAKLGKTSPCSGERLHVVGSIGASELRPQQQRQEEQGQKQQLQGAAAGAGASSGVQGTQRRLFGQGSPARWRPCGTFQLFGQPATMGPEAAAPGSTAAAAAAATTAGRSGNGGGDGKRHREVEGAASGSGVAGGGSGGGGVGSSIGVDGAEAGVSEAVAEVDKVNGCQLDLRPTSSVHVTSPSQQAPNVKQAGQPAGAGSAADSAAHLCAACGGAATAAVTAGDGSNGAEAASDVRGDVMTNGTGAPTDDDESGLPGSGHTAPPPRWHGNADNTSAVHRDVEQWRADFAEDLASASRLARMLHSILQQSLPPGEHLARPLAALVDCLADMRCLLERSLEPDLEQKSPSSKNGGSDGGGGGVSEVRGGVRDTAQWPSAAWLQRCHHSDPAASDDAEEGELKPEVVVVAACKDLMGQRFFTAKLLRVWYRELVQAALGIGAYREGLSGSGNGGDRDGEDVGVGARVPVDSDNDIVGVRGCGRSEAEAEAKATRGLRCAEQKGEEMLECAREMRRTLRRVEAAGMACRGIWVSGAPRFGSSS